jgi:hypothetical protein
VKERTATTSDKDTRNPATRERHATLIASLLQEEIRRREQALLAEWRSELGTLQPSRG